MKLAKQRAPLVEHWKCWKSIVLFDVDSFEAELTRSLCEGWLWKKKPLLSSEQRQYMLKRREAGAGNPAPSSETPALIGGEPDLIVPFQLSHNQLTFSQYLIKATFD